MLLFIGATAQKAKLPTYDREGCETKYLKDGGFLPNTFPSQPPKSSCDMLDTNVQEIFSKLKVQNEKMNFDGECSIKALKDNKMQRFWFLQNVYSKANHLSAADKEKKLKEIKAQEKTLSEEKLAPCIKLDVFKTIFDHLRNIDDADVDQKDDYCVRKYVLDKKLVEQRYKVKLNPKNIETSKINCVNSLKDSERDSARSFIEERGFSIEKKVCIGYIFKSGQYFDNIAVASVLKGSEITKEQLVIERNKFVGAMMKFTKETSQCIGE